MTFVCLVVEPIVIVADDLSTIIQEHMPDVAVATATTAQEALETLKRVGRVAVAFVNAPPDSFGASPLGIALAEANAAVVFLGYETEARAANAQFLERPFLGESVSAALKRALGAPGVR